MRLYGYNGATRTLTAAAGTVVFGPNDVPSDGVVAYTISMSVDPLGGANGVSRIRVKENGSICAEYTAGQLAAYSNLFTQSPALVLGTTLNFVVPVNLFDAPTQAAQDVCQMQAGSAPTVEVDYLAPAAAPGTIQVGWIQTTVTPQLKPLVTTRLTGFTGGGTNQRQPLGQAGNVRAMAFTVTNMDRLQINLSGRQVLNMSEEALQAAGVLSGAPNPVGSTPVYALRPDWMLPATEGNSYLLMDLSGANNSETSVFSVVPQS